MERITVTSTEVCQVVKDYIHVDCPVCKHHVISWVEDGDSGVLDPCSHYLGFEWDNDQDKWVVHFEGKVPEKEEKG